MQSLGAVDAKGHDKANPAPTTATTTESPAKEDKELVASAKKAESAFNSGSLLDFYANQNTNNFLGTLSESMGTIGGASATPSAPASPTPSPMEEYIQQMELQMGGSLPPTPKPVRSAGIIRGMNSPAEGGGS